MTEMRRCKECGKLFQPKGREQYCPSIHYRPCPICGEPVVVKYLSDPPRRCDKCKSAKQIRPKAAHAAEKATITSQLASKNAVIEFNSSGDVREYIGKKAYRGELGFRPNHIYELNLSQDNYSYIVQASYDYTSDEEVNITELFSSKISIAGHFRKVSD